MSIKKKLMELMWRMQQSQTIIGVLMWSLTLTGIFYPYLRDKFGLDPGNVLLPMMLLFLFILGMVILIGVVFDKLRFWKEQNIVLAERNPYATYKFYPKEIHWARLWLLMARQVPNPTPEMQKQMEFFEKWMDRLVCEDPKYRREVEEIEAFVGGKAPPAGEAPR
jgi:hypothetical protein